MSSDRATVRTYVPSYQKALWKEHADELGMSQSEFVRTMVQAGRRGFEPGDSDSDDVDDSSDAAEPRSTDATPRGEPLKDRVEDVLDDGGYYDWDELLDELTDNIEERLDETLQELQSDGRIRYSGRNGGYVLDE